MSTSFAHRGPPARVAGAVLALAMTLLAGPARAGTISLELAPSAEVREGSLVVSLRVRNVGDEAASSVSPTLRFRGATARGEVVPLLRPEGALELTLAIAAPELRAGRWPYAIAIDYADANQYPLHALHVGTLVAGAPPPPTVALMGVDSPTFAAEGALEARVKNLSGEAREVSVEVHLPDGIELVERIPPVALEGWGEREVSASLVNRTGLPGSRYAVFVSAEYDDGDLHQAVVVPASVEIVSPQSVFERHGRLLWAIAGILVLGWVAFLLRRRAGRR